MSDSSSASGSRPDLPHWRREDSGDVAVLVLDVPGKRLNTLTDRTFAELHDLVGEVAADDRVAGAVLIGGKPEGFCTGADIDRLPELRDAADPLPALELAHATVLAIAGSAKPFVAALHGAALGGGLELALACHARVAASTEETRFGLPEVRLGLMPGAGGTQHLPRLLPLPVALEHLLTGKTMYTARARALGLLDDALPANQLRRAAVTRARDMAAAGAVRWGARVEPPPPEQAAAIIAGARALAQQRSKGLHAAPGAILDAVETGLRDGLEAGMAAEREAFVSLLKTPEAAAGIHLFAAAEQAKRHAHRSDAPEIGKVFVLGGGMMGAGLAALAVDRGLHTRVRDVDPAALAGVRRYTDRALRRSYGKRKAAFAVLYRERFHRLSTTTDLDGIGTAGAVIEAVFENADLKVRVLAEAEARMRPDALLASNTSAIRIGRLAKACRRPERFLGMHFFSPAERMPLVEIIPHAGTSDDALAAALTLSRQLGKTPIVVGDSPGFYTSRVFGRWLAEGLRLVMAGVEVERVDGTAESLGFPVGPLTAYDEVSLELAGKVAGDPEIRALSGQGFDVEPVRAAVDALLAAGHAGRRAGLGFYRYVDGERSGPAPGVHALVQAAGSPALSDEDVRDRLLYAFVSEALACLDGGLLRSASDGDVGAVLGIGFPPNLGGPFHYVDRVGPAAAAALMESLDARFGGFPWPGAARA